MSLGIRHDADIGFATSRVAGVKDDGGFIIVFDGLELMGECFGHAVTFSQRRIVLGDFLAEAAISLIVCPASKQLRAASNAQMRWYFIAFSELGVSGCAFLARRKVGGQKERRLASLEGRNFC